MSPPVIVRNVTADTPPSDPPDDRALHALGRPAEGCRGGKLPQGNEVPGRFGLMAHTCEGSS